jgi:hypothetical protein
MTRGRINRREFPVAVQLAIVARATDKDGRICCEACGEWCPKRSSYEIDHTVPEAMRSAADRKRRLTAAEGRVLCRGGCHKAKTKVDVGHIAIAKRREAKALGLKPPGTVKIPYRGKPSRKPLRVAEGVPEIMRRFR